MRKIFTIIALLAIGGPFYAQISVLPHYQDFEGESTCGINCGDTCNLTGSWKNELGDDMDWTVDVGGTQSGNTGPSIDHKPGNSSGKYLYTEGSGTACQTAKAGLISPWFDFTNLISPSIKFWYHMYGAQMGILHFDVDTTKGIGAWSNDFDSPWTDNKDEWQEKVIDLSTLIGRDSLRFRIRAVTGLSFLTDMAIDDITVFQPLPFDVGVIVVDNPETGCGLSTMESVDIQVKSFGLDTITAGTMIPVAYDFGNGIVWDTLPLVTDLYPGDTVFFTFTVPADLSITGEYNFYAWTALPDDTLDNANDTLKMLVQSVPNVNTFGYCEDFETGRGGWSEGGTNSSWEHGTIAKTVIIGAASGTEAWVTGGVGAGAYQPNEDSWVNSPCFDFSNLENPNFQCKIWYNSESGWDGTVFQSTTDGGLTWQDVGASGEPNNWFTSNFVQSFPGGSANGWTGRGAQGDGSGTWLTAKHRLDSLGGESAVRFRFAFASDANIEDDGFGFDDVAIWEGISLPEDTTICDTEYVIVPNLMQGNPFWSTGASSPTLRVTLSGTYALTFQDTVQTDCDGNFLTTTDSITVTFLSVNVPHLGADTTICLPDTVTFSTFVNPTDSIIWSTGSTLDSIDVDSSGSFWVRIETTDGCIRYDTTEVVGLTSSFDVLLGPDTNLCAFNYPLDAGYIPNANYNWSTGDTTQAITISSSTVVGVTVNTACGTYQDTISVVISGSPPIVNLGSDTSSCNNLTLDAGNPGLNYAWIPAGTSQTLLVTVSGDYSVTVSDSAGCSGADTISITMLPGLIIGIGSDTTICPSDQACYTAGTDSSYTYSWSNGGSGLTECINGPLTLSVLVTDSNGCVGSDTATVTNLSVPSADMLFDNSLCPEISFTDNSTGNPTSWHWLFGNGFNATSQNPKHTFTENKTYTITLISTNDCASDTTTKSLTITCIIGLEDPFEGAIQLFPNPSKGKFTVSFTDVQAENAEIIVTDLLGKIQAKRVVNQISGVTKESFNLSNLASGLYLVKVNMLGKSLIRRLIIE